MTTAPQIAPPSNSNFFSTESQKSGIRFLRETRSAMNSLSQENAVAQGEPEARKEAEPLARPRPKNTRPPLPEDYKNLCALCRAGKLFAVQEWFKTHKYNEPERYDCKHWPIGIAIEKGFHSLVEVLLQNGVPADARALQRAAEYRNHDIVNLVFQFGATVDMVEFEHIVWIGDKEIIGNFIERGADLVTGYPIAKGLIRLTRLFLGIYKSNIEKHPELQFQADMALRHFCSEGNLRGVSLLMWLGANPRAKIPSDAGDDQEYWETALEAAAWQGKLDIIKRLKPNASIDNANALLRSSLSRRNMDLIRYWISLGADINRVDEDGDTAHRHVVTSLEWALDSRNHWYGGESTSAKQFANEWFSSGAIWKAVHLDTGRIHTTYHQLDSATGRLSSTDPNLQNIPIRSALGQEVRKAFVPRNSDFLLLTADYSQIELRILAALSQEPALIAALNAGEDVHVSTAAKVFGVPLSQVTAEMRDKAKMVNYGVSYGMSAFGLAQRLGISRTEAAAFIEKYFTSLPQLSRYNSATVEFARQTGYVQTITGRRRYLPDINSRNATIRKAAERNAVNMPIQGTAADMIKLAMISIHRELAHQNLKTRMLLQVHDELVFDLFKPEKEEVTALVEDKMRNALPLDVPIEVQIGTGNNWLEAH